MTPRTNEVADERGDDQGEGAFHPVILSGHPSGPEGTGALRCGLAPFS